MKNNWIRGVTRINSDNFTSMLLKFSEEIDHQSTIAVVQQFAGDYGFVTVTVKITIKFAFFGIEIRKSCPISITS